MKRMAATLGVALLGLGLVGAGAEQDAAPKTIGSITVVFTGLDNDEGRALIALIDSKEAYDAGDRAFRQARSPIADGEARHTFEDVPFGTYAVKVVHDENTNDELDTNLVGMPKEAFGFSNDAFGRFGPPDFAATSFALDQPRLVLEIRAKRL